MASPMSLESFSYLTKVVLLSFPFNISNYFYNKLITPVNDDPEIDPAKKAEDSINNYGILISAYAYVEGSATQIQKTLTGIYAETSPPTTSEWPSIEGLAESFRKLSFYYLQRKTIDKEQEKIAIKEYVDSVEESIVAYAEKWLSSWKEYEATHSSKKAV